jgi:hypothetical protein
MRRLAVLSCLGSACFLLQMCTLTLILSTLAFQDVLSFTSLRRLRGSLICGTAWLATSFLYVVGFLINVIEMLRVTMRIF